VKACVVLVVKIRSKNDPQSSRGREEWKQNGEDEDGMTVVQHDRKPYFSPPPLKGYRTDLVKNNRTP